MPIESGGKHCGIQKRNKQKFSKLKGNFFARLIIENTCFSTLRDEITQRENLSKDLAQERAHSHELEQELQQARYELECLKRTNRKG